MEYKLGMPSQNGSKRWALPERQNEGIQSQRASLEVYDDDLFLWEEGEMGRRKGWKETRSRLYM